MNAPIDYTAVLTDLEAKRGQIDAAIAVIRSLIGAGATDLPAATTVEASDGAAAPSTAAPRPAAILDDAHAFFKLSTPAAVKKFLSMMKKPQSVRTIANAMREGGQVRATDDTVAYTNVYTALKRGLGTDFYQTKNKEWGLKEWQETSRSNGE